MRRTNIKRIIVLTRAVRCKSKEREIDGAMKGSQAVFMYSSWHLASLGIKGLSPLSLSRNFCSFPKESLRCLTFQVSLTGTPGGKIKKRLNGFSKWMKYELCRIGEFSAIVTSETWPENCVVPCKMIYLHVVSRDRYKQQCVRMYSFSLFTMNVIIV